MRTRLMAALSVLGLSLLAGCDRPEAARAAVPQVAAATVARAGEAAPPVTAEGSIPVIEFAGTPEAIGARHAERLWGPIHELFEKYLKPYFKSETQRFLALGAAGMFEARLLPEHRAEIRALAAASKLDEREVMLAQCFLDLSPNVACSTITLPASASPDGVARFGRNLDFPGKGVADKQSVVMIYRPEGRYAFAAVSWPGLTGVLSGMNEHGLALANMELKRPRRVPTAMPYILLYRSVLERCRTVEEAVTFLERTPRQSANNLMLMDASGDRAVVEISPDAVVVRRAAGDLPLVSTNHTRGVSGDPAATGYCRRYDALWSGATEAFGRVDVAGMRGLLADAGAGARTLQSMVFEPSTLTLYVAAGERAYERPMRKVELGPYFAR